MMPVEALTDLSGRHGLGQDFVVQARGLREAVDLAMGAVAVPASACWAARAVLLAGSADALAAVRAALPPQTPSPGG